MKRAALAILMILPFTLFLFSCTAPTYYMPEPWDIYDDNTQYKIEEGEGSFKLFIVHSRYQFIPEISAVTDICRQQIMNMAYEHAEKQGREIYPINEQRIKLSNGRNAASGMTSCSALIDVKYK